MLPQIHNICKSLNDPPAREIHTFSFMWPNPEKGLFMKTPSVPLRNREMCRKISSQTLICCLRRLLSYLPVKFRSRLILLLLHIFKLQFESVNVSSLRFDHLWSFLGNLKLWFVVCLESGGKGE